MNVLEKIRWCGEGFRRAAQRYPYIWFVLGMLLLVWSVWVNLFPEGYIISGGDVLQLLRAHDNFWFLHYEWAGRVSLFYSLFYLLDSLGVSETGQLSWYLGVFLFSSYVSFYAFVRLMFPRASGFVSMFTALLYATNVYTLYIFTSTWGYTHYQVLYVFIPALVGLFAKALRSRDRVWRYVFLLVVFLASGGSFGNPAFAFSLALFFAFLVVALFAIGETRSVFATIKTVSFLAFGSLVLNAYWILPLVPQIESGIAGVSASTDIVLSEALQKTSNAISDTIRLIQTGERDIYYPYNFPYQSLSWLEQALPLVAFIPFFVVLIGYGVLRRKEEKRYYVLFLSLFVVFVFLVARVRFPFETINNFLFQLPGFNVLRGYDKTAIYTPFLLMTLLTTVLIALQSRKRLFVATVSLLSVYGVLMALPFYVGGIQTKMSYILDGKKNFQSSKYSALIHLPREYYDIQAIIDGDASDGKVARLPFSEGSSIGRVNLPRLKVNGPAPERFMYTKTFVDPNELYFPHWRFGEDVENASYDPQWIVEAYGLMGVKYIVYHKDAKPSSLEKMDDMMRFLENNEMIVLVSENDWLSLYRIDDRHIFPYAYVSFASDTEIPEKVSGILGRARALKDRVAAAEYVRHPDKSVEAAVHRDFNNTRTFILSEKYDLLWQAEFVDASGKSRLLERDERIVYANGWKLDAKDGEGKVIVRYLPVVLFYKGALISGLALLMIVIGCVSSIKKQRKHTGYSRVNEEIRDMNTSQRALK